MYTDEQLKTKREKTRLRVENHRARIKEIEAANLNQVDSSIEISSNDARKILTEERGLHDRHGIDTCVHLLKTAGRELQLPFKCAHG